MGKIYLLNNQRFENVENIEVFKIDYLPSLIDILKYDALIFTSKNAIYSLASFNQNWKEIPAFVIADKTANVLKENGGNLEFIANAKDGNEFANKLILKLKNKKALYIRAKKVVSDLVEILEKNSIDIDELITYKTSCNKNSIIQIENNSVIVFTSPSSVECFFKQYDWNDSLKAVVIGKTTAKYLPDNIDFIVSSKTSVQECIKLAQSLTL